MMVKLDPDVTIVMWESQPQLSPDVLSLQEVLRARVASDVQVISCPECTDGQPQLGSLGLLQRWLSLESRIRHQTNAVAFPNFADSGIVPNLTPDGDHPPMRTLTINLCHAIDSEVEQPVISVTSRGRGISSPDVAAFDVIAGKSSVPFSIWLHDQHGRQLLYGSDVNVSTWVSDTQRAVRRKALGQLLEILNPVISAGHSNETSENWTDESDVVTTMSRIFRYICKRVLSALQPKTIKRRKKPLWQVYIADSSPSLTTSATWMPLQPESPDFTADPFPLEINDETLLYVEEIPEGSTKGRIACFTRSEAAWTRVGSAVEEGHHLSFPYLFRFSNETFMCPEATESGVLMSYLKGEGPCDWTAHKEIVRMPMADAQLFEWEGRWWLLGNLDTSGLGLYGSELYAFHSDSPFSDTWVPHQANPIVHGADRARNGGMLLLNGVRYRVSQEQRGPIYGYSYSVRKIDLLTPHAYAESLVTRVVPDDGYIATHHLTCGDTAMFTDRQVKR